MAPGASENLDEVINAAVESSDLLFLFLCFKWLLSCSGELQSPLRVLNHFRRKEKVS